MITIEVTPDEVWALASVVQDRYNDNLVEICKEKRLLRSFFLKTGIFDEYDMEKLKECM